MSSLKKFKKQFSDLKVKKVYLIGIKGSAMVALAEILSAKGVEVLGSDTEEVFYTDEILRNAGIKFFEGFDVENIPKKVDLVIYSMAYNENNPELKAVFAKKIPNLSYPEALGLLLQEKYGIAICGSHGKTTTTAMVGEILKEAKENPTVLVGSKVVDWQACSLVGSGKYFVIEADEYQNKLRFYKPKAVIVTNIDYDHPDFFPLENDYYLVFRKFFQKISSDGFLIINRDDKNSFKIAKGRKIKAKVITIGKTRDADYQLIKRVSIQGGGQMVEFLKNKIFNKNSRETFKRVKHGFTFSLKLNGEHNALNALQAIALAEALGIKEQKIFEGLKNFSSSERRLQVMGKYKGALLLDDYAHHPSEILATLKSIQEKFLKKKIILGFHPHTFTRTFRLLNDFAFALAQASKVYVIDIYPSARENLGKIRVHSKDLIKLINQQKGNGFYVPRIQDLAKAVQKELDKNTVFVSMGAGDIWRVHEMILKDKF